MKKKIIIIISALVIILVLATLYKSVVKKKISAVLPNRIAEAYGHRVFQDAQWSLVSLECEEGGFNILDYASKEIVIQRSLAIGKFYLMIPLNINKIYVGDKVICEYYTDSSGLLAPGIFAINDPTIIKMW